MLSNYVPPFLYNEKILNQIYNAQQVKINDVDTDIQDLINQCFVETATWGLDYWESDLGLETISFDSYALRRSRVKARLRGQGTSTIALIKNVVESFSNGTVDIIEHNSEYYFEVKFVSTIGIPPKIDDVYAAIQTIKPAHLGVVYTFKYSTWQNALSMGTWQDVLNKGTWSNVLNDK